MESAAVGRGVTMDQYVRPKASRAPHQLAVEAAKNLPSASSLELTGWGQVLEQRDLTWERGGRRYGF